MSKLTDIKDKINQLEGGAFQEFCDYYLSKKGYDGIFELGMKSGSMKTTIGNPDTYFKGKLNSGKYVLVGYTTQQTNINSKIREDIEKCLDKEKTGLDLSEIEEIICCHTSSTLKAGDDRELHKLCEDKNISFSLYGIDRIANDIYRYYPVLAKDFLGISVDTNQISDITEFIERYDSNDISAPLETKFQFRDNEIEDLLLSIENNKVSILLGSSGVGKTRLALEGIKIFSEKHTYKLLCIRSNDLPIYEDLISYIPIPGNYLIFIDDANELDGLQHVLRYLNMANKGYNVKLVMTVRDYAKEYVMHKVREFIIPKEINIEKFTDDEIKEILKENLEIINPLYLKQIAKIAEGNSRIAFLAGKLAKDKQSLTSIQDATQLYEVYYGKYISKSNISSDKHLCIVAGIISLLHTINLGALERLEPVLKVFELDKDDFIDKLKDLHEKEFVEIHYDSVARISDQCLSNYMIYYVFFERKIISFSKILDVGFRYFREGLIRVISILLNIFYCEETKDYISKEIGLVWEDYKKQDDDLFFEFLRIFHDFRPEESLLYIQEKIEYTEGKSVDIDTMDFDKNIYYYNDKILETLSGYSHSSYIKEALELLIMYVQKRQDKIVEIYNVLCSNFGIDSNSYQNGYYSISNVAEVLTKYDNNKQLVQHLFINIARKFLNLIFSSTESTKKNNVVVYEIPLELTEEVKHYRKIIWEKLIELCKYEMYQKNILDVISNYTKQLYKKIDLNILEFDFVYIEILIKELRYVNPLKVAKLCDLIIKKYKDYNILENKNFDEIFKCKEWEIYSILSEKYYCDNISYEESELKRSKVIEKYALDYDIEKLDEFIGVCNKMTNECGDQSWEINHGLGLFFKGLENDKAKYLVLINAYIDSGEHLYVYPDRLIETMFRHIGVENTFDLVKNKNFKQKNAWEFSFFKSLSEEIIDIEWTEKLIEFLKKEDDMQIKMSSMRDLRFLDKYKKIKPNIYIEAVEIINEKFKYSPFIGEIYLRLLFNVNAYEPREVLSIFKDNLSILQESYFNLAKYKKNADYGGKFIKTFIENDESWLTLYVDNIINILKTSSYDEFDNIKACWLSNDYIQIFDYIYYQLEEVDEIYKRYITKYFQNLLAYSENEKSITDNQKIWLKHMIKENNDNSERIIDIFSIISELGSDMRKELILYFIDLNKDYELFEQLELEPNHWGGMNGMIPDMESRIEFYEYLLPYLTGIKLLKHRNLVIGKIDMWKRMIKNEQIEEILDARFMS